MRGVTMTRSRRIAWLTGLACLLVACAAGPSASGTPTATLAPAATTPITSTPEPTPEPTLLPAFRDLEAPDECPLAADDVPSEYEASGGSDDGTQPDEWLSGHLQRLGPTPPPDALAEREAELSDREFLGGWFCHYVVGDPATMPPSIFTQVLVFSESEGAEAEMEELIDSVSCQTLEELDLAEDVGDVSRAFECTAELPDGRQRRLIQLFFVAANAFHYIAVSALTDSPARPELADALPLAETQLEPQRTD